ncbi:hypothetical protein CKO31_02425 [Thiohalocapsa halophila]|uniref:PEP-CTERM sorting domain-containing protein n=1 Tax=Thiohalocapsa halophila TaxID=69359 RepID=A0ABS1CCL0_9GAMM|nr:DUF1566 domain-containing protein [Thiohalocapsa halophila]MBK1629611.1 hypothetical protein [Thiohalocapsa halophila]
MKTWQGMAAAGLLLAGGGAQAALVPYTSDGVDLVFDNDYTPVGASSPGLTWTADANLAASNTFGLSTGADLGLYPGEGSGEQGRINTDGTMNWPGALFWIDAMNAANYAGANDWRLWSALDSNGDEPCAGWDCTYSELGHLFYFEGGLSQFDSINDSVALTDVFTNMQDNVYWSGTEFSASDAWDFATSSGFQFYGGKDNPIYAWAVRPGQIAAAPLPGTALLMALGLAGLDARQLSRRPNTASG